MSVCMDNVLDYLDWRGDLTFRQSPFNPVDSLILSCLSYIHFDRIVGGEGEAAISLSQAAARFFALPPERQVTRVKADAQLLAAAAKSTRFSGVMLTGYRSELDPIQEKQFGALTFLMVDAPPYLAFRGTDSTLVGWKEDFNMSFLEATPSQLEAVGYLERAARRYAGWVRVGGHSKGGNLAVFAAAGVSAQVQERIDAVYNHDGPGFNERAVQRSGYQAVLPRIHTMIPQSSIVGMLLEHEEPYSVIRSGQVGFLQHDPYSWEVRGGDFIRLETVTAGSRFIDQTLKTWVAEMDVAQREAFFDTVFQVFSAPGSQSFADLTSSWLKHPSLLRDALSGVDPEKRKVVGKTISMLMSAGGRSLQAMLRSHENDKGKDAGESVRLSAPTALVGTELRLPSAHDPAHKQIK